VDPNSPSLNRFTENVGKADTLSNDVATISQGMPFSRKALIKMGENPYPVSQTAPAGCSKTLDSSVLRVGAKPRRRRASAKRSSEPKKTGKSPKPLPSSPGLTSR